MSQIAPMEVVDKTLTKDERGGSGLLMNFFLHPKTIFLTAAFLSLLLSVYLWFMLEDKLMGIFVGLWVPSILSAGNLAMTQTNRGDNHNE